MRPVRPKALIINAFAPTGRFDFVYPYTQGVALGYVLIGLSALIYKTLDTTYSIFLLLKAKKSDFVLSIQILFVPLHSLNKTQLVP